MMATEKRQGNHQQKKRNIVETESQRISWLDEITKEKKTTEELISVIISKIEAKPIYYKNVNKIYDHLNQIIKFFYKNQNIGIFLFGSSATNLALEGSDVDIYLDFGENLPQTPEKLVRTLKNKVRKFGYFINAIPVFARVPIVHCIHRSQISCDISVMNGLGVSNSHLIKFLLGIDKRIRPLMLILKFIMKNKGLLGQNAFTSFALINLIIFFLQVLEKPIIPSISYIQNLATKREIVADWDTSFTTDIDSLPPVNNQLSVVELLHKFFEFYSTFEFGFYIICPFTGKSYLKPVFSNPEFMPEEFKLYKENITKSESFKFDFNKFICVQGPFNHGNNITRNVLHKLLIEFQNFCGVNSAYGNELLYKNKTDENEQKYLLKLLELNEDEPKNKKLKKECVVIHVGDKIHFDDYDCTEDDLRKNWSNFVFSNVKDILCKVMKCEIESDTENESFLSGDEEKILKCKIQNCELISKKRNEVKNEFDFPQNMHVINKEEIISNYLCDTWLKEIPEVPVNFDIICKVKKKPTCFCLDLISKETQKHKNHLYQQITHFIQNNFPKWIK